MRKEATYVFLAETEDPAPGVETEDCEHPEVAFWEELREEKRPRLNSRAFSFLCSSCT